MQQGNRRGREREAKPRPRQRPPAPPPAESANLKLLLTPLKYPSARKLSKSFRMLGSNAAMVLVPTPSAAPDSRFSIPNRPRIHRHARRAHEQDQGNLARQKIPFSSTFSAN